MGDLRVALRGLRRQPAFAVTTMLTLALAIGANAAVFSMVDALLLRPLPYPDADRLGLVSRVATRGGVVVDESFSHSGAVFEAIRDGVLGVEVAAVSGTSAQISLVAGDAAIAVRPQRVSAGYFGLLGVAPLIGRTFAPDEDRPGGTPVVLLSHRLWQTALGGDPSIVGRTLRLRGTAHAVTGIMPPSFRTDVEADVWTPLQPSRSGEGEGENYGVLLRLGRDTAWPEVRSAVSAAAATVGRRPLASVDLRLDHGVVPLQDGSTREARAPLLLLWGAVGLVLLIACTNIAGLMLARAGGRTREIATRVALGGSRTAIVRQLLLESLILAAAGGLMGVVIGALALEVVKPAAANILPAWGTVSLDARAVAATGGLTLLTAVLFGLFPALHATRRDVRGVLAAGGTRSVAAGAGGWPRRLLVVGQVALGAVLLVGSGLLFRSLLHLQSRPLGFDPDRLVTASASLEDARYADHAAVARLFDRSLEYLSELPGVAAVAVSLGLPYERILNMSAEIVGSSGGVQGARFSTATYVTPGYFATIRLPILSGREFEPSDGSEAAAVIIVNEAFARRYFGDDAVGRYVRIAGRSRRVVGVGATVPQQGGFAGFEPVDALPGVYLPFAQFPAEELRVIHAWFSPAWLLRTHAPGAVTEAQLQAAMRRVDAELPLSAVRSIEALRGSALVRQRLLATVVAVLGGAALLLSALGIHGVLASGVAERRRELGIRLALGSTVGQAVRRVSADGLALAAAGLVAGGFAAFALAGLLGRFVWGVPAHDPWTFAAAAAILLLAAAVASVLPALDVRRIDPATLLRE